MKNIVMDKVVMIGLLGLGLIMLAASLMENNQIRNSWAAWPITVIEFTGICLALYAILHTKKE